LEKKIGQEKHKKKTTVCTVGMKIQLLHTPLSSNSKGETLHEILGIFRGPNQLISSCKWNSLLALSTNGWVQSQHRFCCLFSASHTHSAFRLFHNNTVTWPAVLLRCFPDPEQQVFGWSSQTPLTTSLKRLPGTKAGIGQNLNISRK
jgi:hypothetical protein